MESSRSTPQRLEIFITSTEEAARLLMCNREVDFQAVVLLEDGMLHHRRMKLGRSS